MYAKRILIVDDSCMYQRLIADVIDEHPVLEVVGVASNGKQALDMMSELKPDLVTLDILMPEMDGIQTLMEMCRCWPNVRTVMVSSLTSVGSEAALDALALGADEFSEKPCAESGTNIIRKVFRDGLIPKLEALCGIESVELSRSNDAGSARKPLTPNSALRNTGRITATPKLIAIGVSTGGPDALAQMLAQLPADFEVPLVIVQHMPAEFTPKLAQRLDAACKLTVREAVHGDKLQAGTVYIAPGDYHMVLKKVAGDTLIQLNQNPPENSCRPSVDPLFRSAAIVYGDACLGIVMTGMGQDGLKGCEALQVAGGSVLVQDEATSIVWGMPKLVAQAGLADEELPLNMISRRILDRVRPALLAGNSFRSVAQHHESAIPKARVRQASGGLHS